MIDRAGSDGGFFLEGYDADADDIVDALDSFSTRAMALDLQAAYGRVPKRPGVCYFFPRPSAGSACKRLNLFLRWMVRRDAPGSRRVDARRRPKLIVPLDTHVIRVGRCLRLTSVTRARGGGWRATSPLHCAEAGPNRIQSADFLDLPPRHDERRAASRSHEAMRNARLRAVRSPRRARAGRCQAREREAARSRLQDPVRKTAVFPGRSMQA